MSDKVRMMIWEVLSKAGPVAVNGYPTFFSMHWEDEETTKRIWDEVERIEKAVKAVEPQEVK